MHMAEVAPYAGRGRLVVQALRLLARPDHATVKAERQAILHKIFDGWGATSDFPGMVFYEDLMDMYPDAKIILNKRKNSQVWAQSIRRTLAYFNTTRYSVITKLWTADRLLVQMVHTTHLIAKIHLGIESYFEEQAYDAHNAAVRKAANSRGREVLEWTPDMGYAPLCELFEVSAPDGEFPRSNDEKEVRLIQNVMLARGLLS